MYLIFSQLYCIYKTKNKIRMSSHPSSHISSNKKINLLFPEKFQGLHIRKSNNDQHEEGETEGLD